MSDTEITRIVVRMGDAEVSLTPEQLRSLRKTLDDLFGERVVERRYDYTPWWTRPHIYWYNSSGVSSGDTYTIRTDHWNATKDSSGSVCLALSD